VPLSADGMRRELESAFRRARYRVFAPAGELLLRIDQPDEGLAALLRMSGAGEAALLTAFNPHGRRQAPFRNRQSQRQLARALMQQGRMVLPARNEDPRGRWPVEPSLLVTGMSSQDARQLAARFHQAAFLLVEAGGTPRLIETAAR
jgi:hypothetical protein